MFLIHKSPRQVRGDLFFSLARVEPPYGRRGTKRSASPIFKDANGILKK